MKGHRVLLVVGLVLLLGAACAPASPAPPTAAAPAPKAAPPTAAAPAPEAKPAPTAAQPAAAPAATKSLVDAAKAEGKLVIYNSATTEVLDLMTKGFTAKYGIQVDVTKKSAGEIVQMVDAERRAGKVRADVLGIGEEIRPTVWAREGLLAKYQPESVKDVLPELRDPDGFWVSPYLSIIGIISDNRRLKEAERPKTFKELADPKWRGRLGTSPSRTSGVGSVMTNVLSNLYGWSFFEDVAKNEPLLMSSVSGLPAMVTNGEIDVMFPASDSLGKSQVARGEPVTFIYPADVVPLSMGVFSIGRDAANPNAARLFLEFILTEEGQKPIVEQVGLFASNAKLPPPTGGVPLKDLKLKRADVPWMIDHANEQHDRFDSIFRGFKVR